MANGKKKRSLREAFSTVSAPAEKSGTAPPSGEDTVGWVVAPESTKSTPADVEKTEKKPAPVRRAARARMATHPMAVLMLEEEARTEGIPVIL